MQVLFGYFRLSSHFVEEVGILLIASYIGFLSSVYGYVPTVFIFLVSWNIVFNSLLSCSYLFTSVLSLLSYEFIILHTDKCNCNLIKSFATLCHFSMSFFIVLIYFTFLHMCYYIYIYYRLLIYAIETLKNNSHMRIKYKCIYCLGKGD